MTNIEDMTKKAVLEERMQNQEEHISQSQAMSQMYEKARDAAAGPTSVPRRPTPSRGRKRNSSASY